MGLRDIERKIRSKSSYQRKEAELLLDELDKMIEDLEILKSQLKKFEKKHRDKIEDNKDYYEKVNKIRDELGLPREVGIYEWKESPSLKDKMTGGGFYNQLANEILEIGKNRARETGGLLSLAEVVLILNKERPGKLVAPDDVLKATDKLLETGLIQNIRKLESGVRIVEFFAIELSNDQQRVLDLASKKGYITLETVMLETGWNSERTERVLSQMEKEGIAIVEKSIQEGKKYWFPSLGE